MDHASWTALLRNRMKFLTIVLVSIAAAVVYRVH